MNERTAPKLYSHARGLIGHAGPHWRKWMKNAEALYLDWAELPDDPYAYNETASASALAAAATRAGWLALAEYQTSKRKLENLSEARHGCRCDLWVRHSAGETWAIELKQMLPAGLTLPTARQIALRMAAAKKDATCLSWREADVRLAGVVISTWYVDQRRRSAAEAILRDAAETVDAAALFGSARSLTCVLMDRVGG